MWSLPWISVPTVALFFAEVRGYAKLYDKVDDWPLGKFRSVQAGNRKRINLSVTCVCVFSGWPGIAISMIAFLFFTDMCIYWIHRFLHHKRIYKVSLVLIFY